MKASTLGLIGIGDSFLYNDGRAAGAIVGDIDWDGDGVPDHVYSRTRVYEYGVEQDEKIGYGTFFYKNLGNADHQIYDRGIGLKAPNGEYLLDKGYTYFDVKPFDWNADGHPDLIGFRGYDLCIMQNTGKRDRNKVYVLEQPRVLQTLNQATAFREGLSTKVISPSF